MRVFGRTDIGLVRRSNQDAFQKGSFSDYVTWAVVCDGMGGANGGNIASQIAVDLITQQITSSYRENISSNSIKNLLMTAVYNANAAIYERAQKDPSLEGMGTTVEAAIAVKDTLHIAHVGDSRAYLITQKQARQITKDHSMVQEMVDRGEITLEQAQDHPRKNIITRALGVRPQVDIDYYEVPFEPRATLLLCTDGLSNYLEPDTIHQIASEEPELDNFVNRLVDLSKEMGGRDNITVVAIGY